MAFLDQDQLSIPQTMAPCYLLRQLKYNAYNQQVDDKAIEKFI